jgi:hypothetical protein
VRAHGIDALVSGVAVVATRAVGIVPDASTAAGQLLADAESVVVLAPRAARCATRIERDLGAAVTHVQSIDPGRLRGETLVAALAAWLSMPESGLAEEARELLRELAHVPVPQDAHSALDAARLPRRGDALHRGVTPTVAAGLALAQGVIGVPGRVDPSYPTYRTDTGVPLTVAPAPAVALHGVGAAAPASGIGVIVAVGSAAGLEQAAAAAGATVEHVDGSSPRAIGHAVARACSAPRVAWHVIVVGAVTRVAAPRAATFGMDPDLVGTERIATAAVPTSATVLVDLGDELADGPAVLAVDRPEAVAALAPVRELSPATWDLRHRPASGRAARARWGLQRRLVRAAAGVDL